MASTDPSREPTPSDASAVPIVPADVEGRRENVDRPVLGPLAGIRVVDLTAFVSGPLATSILADQGADVIKIERIEGGDGLRHLGPRVSGVSPNFATVNRNKRSIAVDLKSDEGVELVVRLTAGADVFIQNLRPGVVERLGLGESDLRGADPDLVYTSISGFGSTGPFADQGAYDSVIQASSGIAAHQGRLAEGGTPTFVRNAISDKATGYAAAQLTTAALLARARGLGGQHVEVSMLAASIHFMWSDGMQDVAFPDPGPGPVVRASQPPVLRTSDGHVAVSTTTDDSFRRFCRVLGVEEIADDPRYGDTRSRFSRTGEVTEILAPHVARFSTDELVTRLREVDVFHAVVTPLDRVHEHEQVRHLDLITEVRQEPAGPMRQPAPVGFFHGTPSEVRTPAPSLGEHTDEVLAELGVDADEVQRLRARQIVA